MPSMNLSSNCGIVAVAPERRHGTAQTVRLRAGEAGRDDRHPHRLFLEQRHAQRFAENLAQFVLARG